MQLWKGLAGPGPYETEVRAGPRGVEITQDDCGYHSHVYLDRDEAIDIAFAILRDCAPTLAETLMSIAK